MAPAGDRDVAKLSIRAIRERVGDDRSSSESVTQGKTVAPEWSWSPVEGGQQLRLRAALETADFSIVAAFHVADRGQASHCEQRAQRTDVCNTFQQVDLLDQLFRLLRSENRRHQVPRLGAYCFGAERIFLRARRKLRETIDLLSVCESHFDDRAARRG